MAGLLKHSYTGHVDAVTALLGNPEAIQARRESAGFVPLQEPHQGERRTSYPRPRGSEGVCSGASFGGPASTLLHGPRLAPPAATWSPASARSRSWQTGAGPRWRACDRVPGQTLVRVRSGGRVLHAIANVSSESAAPDARVGTSGDASDRLCHLSLPRLPHHILGGEPVGHLPAAPAPLAREEQRPLRCLSPGRFGRPTVATTPRDLDAARRPMRGASRASVAHAGWVTVTALQAGTST